MRKKVSVSAAANAAGVSLSAVIDAGTVSVEIDVGGLRTIDDVREAARAALKRAIAVAARQAAATALAADLAGLEVEYVVPEAPTLTLQAGLLSGSVGPDTAELTYRLPNGREGIACPNKHGAVAVHLGGSVAFVAVTPISHDGVPGATITVTEEEAA